MNLASFALSSLWSLSSTDLRIGEQGADHKTHSGPFPMVMASVDDLDGDGIRDLLVGASYSSKSGNHRGSVVAISTMTAEPIFVAHGGSDLEHFGRSVAELGDINGDGTSDFAVSSLWGERAPGVVTVCSGRDGSKLYSISGKRVGDLFGETLTGADINGDGVRELIVGAPGTSTCPPGSGYVSILKGRNGDQLSLIADPSLTFAARISTGLGLNEETNARFGSAVYAIGDYSVNHRDNIYIVAPLEGDGALYRFLASSGKLLDRIDSFRPKTGVAFTFIDPIDLNRDGRLELGIAELDKAITFLDLETNRAVHTIERLPEDRPASGFADSIAQVEDLDGDGSREIAIGYDCHICDRRDTSKVVIWSLSKSTVVRTIDRAAHATVVCAIRGTGEELRSDLAVMLRGQGTVEFLMTAEGRVVHSIDIRAMLIRED